MQLGDITVEVRDKDLTRRGIIRPEELNLTVTGAHNNVGTWSLELAAEHALTPVLRTPGSGIIVTGPNDVMFSGPTTTPSFKADEKDPVGTVSFEGVSDTVVLADRIVFPDPTNPDPTTQTLSHDRREGPAESVMHAYVNAHCGPAAPPVRQSNLTMGVDQARGPYVKKSARFPVLGNLLGEIAVMADLGFRVVQRGDQLVFETYAVEDRSDTIRLDVANGTLSSQSLAITAPGVTQVIVAGQGDLVERQFYHATNAAALAAEEEWGRRIERFVDQRQTSDVAEFEQKAEEVLAKEGFTGIAVKVVPTDDSTMIYGVDWGLGDRVAVVVEDTEQTAIATGYVLKVDDKGVRLGAILGDTTQMDAQSSVTARLTDVEQRVSSLERTAESGGGNDGSGGDLEGRVDDLEATVEGYDQQLQDNQAAVDEAIEKADLLPKIVSHKDVYAGIVTTDNTIGTIFTITLPPGEEMPDANYTVNVAVREYPSTNPIIGSAEFTLHEVIPISASQFKIRVSHVYQNNLDCYIDYVAVQNTATQPDPQVSVVGDPNWIYPALINGWQNYGSGYAPVRYRKLSSGEVEVQGLVRNGSDGGIFQLPQGYRPDGHLILAGSTDLNSYCRLNVRSDGIVDPDTYSNAWVSVCCKFYADH